ncbi:hypothetical protein [Cohnella sp. WQ 127256]|uniref:hypothetical protein n=1 Tax=Cohnella sp. WQ 127256 TaxID=2938790 RepID=UPI002119988C|nr:hypothetical protein [Cohnella sp. WQ 127256]
MKIRNFLSGIVIVLALTGCSRPAVAPIATEQAIHSPIVEIRGPVTLYELRTDYFEQKTIEIPRYSKGEVTNDFTQNIVDGYNEGHSPTLGDPVVQAMAAISNVIPYDYLKDFTIGEQLGKGKVDGEPYQITTAIGIVFTELQRDFVTTRSSSVEAIVPNWGTYTIFFKNSKDSDLQLIQKIIFTQAPDFKIDLIEKPLIVYSVSEDTLQKDISKIPYYVRGDINYVTNEEVQSVNEGHSPWKSTPLLTAQFMTTNLIPEGMAEDQVHYDVVNVENASEDNEITIVEAKVPGLGTYTITLQYAGKSSICFITKVTLQPS